MNTVKKLILTLFLLSGIFPLTGRAQADIITIEGEMNTSVTAYLTRRFSSYSNTKNLIYRMYVPDSQNEGLNTQTISRLRKTFTPYPTEMAEFTDDFGNRGFELIWNKEIRIVQVDLQFSANLYSQFYSINSEAPYPVVVDNPQKIFLTSTELSPSNDFFINYVGRSLSYDLHREIDVVKNIFLWLDKNISLSNKPEHNVRYDALSVLHMREGSERGISNLAASICKGLGIPARVVYGISFQQEIRVTSEKESFIHDYPNDEKYWVEVFFPDLGWVTYDPQGTYFGATSHVVKLSVGPDSDLSSDRWSVEQGEIITFKEFIYDIKADHINIKYQGLGEEDVNKLVLSSKVEYFTDYKKEPDLDSLTDLKVPERTEELQSGATDILSYNIDTTQKLDIVATRNRVYAQQFAVDFPFRLTEVKLPLIKFGDEGRIWLEIYSDNDGIPGEVLFKTYSISSPRVRFMMVDNPWLTFPVGKKTDSRLNSGRYWIALRSSGSCIFNWNASSGNVIGGSRDTRFMDVKLKKPRWNNVGNFDMNFEIIGTRE